MGKGEDIEEITKDYGRKRWRKDRLRGKEGR